MYWSHHERGRQEDYFKINRKFIILTVNSNFYEKLKALSLLSATHSNPQPGGPPMCASRVRTMGPLHYRPGGKKKRDSPANRELFRLVSFRIYFLFGISPFIHFRFLHITFSLSFLYQAPGERFKAISCLKRAFWNGKMLRNWDGKKQGEFYSREKVFFPCVSLSLYCVVIAQRPKQRKRDGWALSSLVTELGGCRGSKARSN